MIRLRPNAQTQIEIADFIGRIEELASPGADAVRPIQETIRAAFAFNFSGEQGDDRPWAPLALYTMRERRRLGFPMDHPILERTGEYKRSFTEEGHAQHFSRWEAIAGKWEIEEGSTDERAGSLEYGRYNMPARPVTLIGRSGEGMLATTIRHMLDQWFED